MQLIDLRHGALGFDCYEPLTEVQYRSMGDLGFSFAVRYLDNLTAPELEIVLTSGLALVPVQVARKPGWKPSGTTGTEDGARARQDAIRLGLHMGLNLFRDLETPSPLTTAEVTRLSGVALAWQEQAQQAQDEQRLVQRVAAVLDKELRARGMA